MGSQTSIVSMTILTMFDAKSVFFFNDVDGGFSVQYIWLNFSIDFCLYKCTVIINDTSV